MCPAGWTVGPPDFVGVGVQRAGTTWWHRLIAGHPEVVAARPKELHFFDRFSSGGFTSADAASYKAFFPRPEGRIAGEWTPRYMLDFWTPRLLRSAAPAAKLLVMLRDPVERYRSGLARETAEADARGALVDPTAWADALSRSLYCAQLDRLMEHFAREQVLLLQYERCCESPERELRRTYDFLGVEPPEHLPGDLGARSRPPTAKAVLPVDVWSDLVAALRPDVEALRLRYPEEVDLGLWPNFAHLA